MLSLLRERFHESIVVPEAVWREVVDEGAERPGAREVSKPNWIKVQRVNDKGMVGLLRAELDEGEAESIALAHEVRADVVLLDERDARQAAMRMGLKVLGTVGILLWGKQTGKLVNLRDLLDALRFQGKFRISQRLYEQVLLEAGE
jgi:predicted nucleic acid-binding protein